MAAFRAGFFFVGIKMLFTKLMGKMLDIIGRYSELTESSHSQTLGRDPPGGSQEIFFGSPKR